GPLQMRKVILFVSFHQLFHVSVGIAALVQMLLQKVRIGDKRFDLLRGVMERFYISLAGVREERKLLLTPTPLKPKLIVFGKNFDEPFQISQSALVFAQPRGQQSQPAANVRPL